MGCVTYIDPDGTIWPWSDPLTGIILTSVTGLGSPPASLTSTALEGGGALAQRYGAAQRTIVVGLHVYDEESQAGLFDLMDRLAAALWTERLGTPAPGTLVFARPGGSARQIEVYCTSGPEQADTEATHDGYQWSTSYALTFVSGLDPLFSDATDTTVPFASAPVGGGVPPMPPVILAPSTVLGSTSVTNSGNGFAYPVWTITGPGTPTISNTTTGRSFGLDVALSGGEVVTVDTRPARQSAIDDDGDDRWGDLVKVSPRDLWTLPPGTSQLDLEMTGSDTNTKIQLAYRRRWLRA
jgi:hypothetical protein